MVGWFIVIVGFLGVGKDSVMEVLVKVYLCLGLVKCVIIWFEGLGGEDYEFVLIIEFES